MVRNSWTALSDSQSARELHRIAVEEAQTERSRAERLRMRLATARDALKAQTEGATGRQAAVETALPEMPWQSASTSSPLASLTAGDGDDVEQRCLQLQRSHGVRPG
eukprot:4591497-Prymnesium_polylepis.1